MKCIPFWGMAWESNSFLLVHDGHAALIDAGVSAKTVLDALEAENVSLDLILLTHGHFDHTVSVDKLREATGATLAVHEDDAEMLTDAEKSALYHFFGTRSAHIPCDKTLSNGHTLSLGHKKIHVIHTPGHSRGSVCYRVDDMLFSGDTLFAQGYGRFDLYGGDMGQLAASLGSLRQLDEALTIYPGHGGATSLGEALENLFDLT